MEPLVSVLCITYNQEEFIGQAIEGFLMQKTNFPFEIIIGEDCSTDRTREIVLTYQRRHPTLLRMITSESNLGGKMNMKRIREAARGKYIAVCEGDDYWTEPFKLQKQVDFLDSHSDFTICFHDYDILYEYGQAFNSNLEIKAKKQVYELEDLISGNFMHTCTVMYRNRLFNEYPDWYFSSPIGDWPLHILNAQYGKIAYIDEKMAVYRVHANGVWSGRDEIDKIFSMEKTYDDINRYFDYKYNTIITETKHYQHNYFIPEKLISEASSKISIQSSFDYLQNAFTHWPKISDVNRFEILKKVYRHFLIKNCVENDRPDLIPYSGQLKSKFLRSVYEDFFFISHEKGDRKSVKFALFRLISVDPGILFRNKGILSISIELYLGNKIARWLRKLF